MRICVVQHILILAILCQLLLNWLKLVLAIIGVTVRLYLVILIIGFSYNYSTKSAPANIDYSESTGVANKNHVYDSVTTAEE